MPVGVTDRVTGRRAAPATLTDFCHRIPLLSLHILKIQNSRNLTPAIKYQKCQSRLGEFYHKSVCANSGMLGMVGSLQYLDETIDKAVSFYAEKIRKSIFYITKCRVYETFTSKETRE